MYQSLLVPLDGSPFAELALPLAASVARRAGASLHVMVVAAHPWLTLLRSEKDTDYLTGNWRAYLDRTVERARALGVADASSALVEGEDVASEILTHAARVRADLIVMTSHGRGAIGRFWLGSVAQALLRFSPAPLLLAPRPGDDLADNIKEPVPRHVLVPLDGSPLAEHMIEPAVAFGGLMNADYTLLRVIHDVPLGTPEFDSNSLSSLGSQVRDHLRTVQARVRKEAQEYLDGVAQRFVDRGLQVRTHVSVANDPGAAILNAAGAPGIDLVALQTHGRHGSSMMAVGRVARKVIHGALRPILVQSAATTPSPTGG